MSMSYVVRSSIPHECMAEIIVICYVVLVNFLSSRTQSNAVRFSHQNKNVLSQDLWIKRRSKPDAFITRRYKWKQHKLGKLSYRWTSHAVTSAVRTFVPELICGDMQWIDNARRKSFSDESITKNFSPNSINEKFLLSISTQCDWLFLSHPSRPPGYWTFFVLGSLFSLFIFLSLLFFRAPFSHRKIANGLLL